MVVDGNWIKKKGLDQLGGYKLGLHDTSLRIESELEEEIFQKLVSVGNLEQSEGCLSNFRLTRNATSPILGIHWLKTPYGLQSLEPQLKPKIYNNITYEIGGWNKPRILDKHIELTFRVQEDNVANLKEVQVTEFLESVMESIEENKKRQENRSRVENLESANGECIHDERTRDKLRKPVRWSELQESDTDEENQCNKIDALLEVTKRLCEKTREVFEIIRQKEISRDIQPERYEIKGNTKTVRPKWTGEKLEVRIRHKDKFVNLTKGTDSDTSETSLNEKLQEVMKELLGQKEDWQTVIEIINGKNEEIRTLESRKAEAEKSLTLRQKAYENLLAAHQKLEGRVNGTSLLNDFSKLRIRNFSQKPNHGTKAEEKLKKNVLDRRLEKFTENFRKGEDFIRDRERIREFSGQNNRNDKNTSIRMNNNFLTGVRNTEENERLSSIKTKGLSRTSSNTLRSHHSQDHIREKTARKAMVKRHGKVCTKCRRQPTDGSQETGHVNLNTPSSGTAYVNMSQISVKGFEHKQGNERNRLIKPNFSAINKPLDRGTALTNAYPVAGNLNPKRERFGNSNTVFEPRGLHLIKGSQTARCKRAREMRPKR